MTGWTQHEADAWIGLLETHKRLTRALDAELDTAHGLGLSTLELLSRLAPPARRGRGYRRSRARPD